MRRRTPLCMRADVPVLQYMPPRRIATNIAKLLLAGAARGEDEPADVTIALRMALSMEGVECRPK